MKREAKNGGGKIVRAYLPWICRPGGLPKVVLKEYDEATTLFMTGALRCLSNLSGEPSTWRPERPSTICLNPNEKARHRLDVDKSPSAVSAEQMMFIR